MRSLLILSLTRCGTNNDNDAAVDRTVNMLQWAVGPDDGSALYRGAIAGNISLLLGLVAFHCLVASLVWILTSRGRNRGKLTAMLFRAHFPGIHAGFLSMLLPGVATGTVHLLWSSAPGAAIRGCFIAIGSLAIATSLFGIGCVVCTRITCLFVKCPAVVVQRAMEAYPKWHAVFASTYMWVDNEDEHLSGYGALFEMYRRGGHREKFFLVESSIALLLAGLGGAKVDCHVTVVSGLVLTVLFLIVVVVYRPYLSRADGWYTIGIGFLQALSMLLSVLALEANIATQLAAAYLNSATTYMSMIKVILDVCHAYYRMVRAGLLKTFLDSLAPESRRRMLHEMFVEGGDEGGQEGLLKLVSPPPVRSRGLTVTFHPVMAETEFDGFLDLPLEEETIDGDDSLLEELVTFDPSITVEGSATDECIASEVQLFEAEQMRAELAAVLLGTRPDLIV